MKDWHVENMKKTVLKYLSGPSENPTYWEKRNYKKYQNVQSVCKRIRYDMKHGVNGEDVVSFFEQIKKDDVFSNLRESDGYGIRIDEIEVCFNKEKI